MDHFLHPSGNCRQARLFAGILSIIYKKLYARSRPLSENERGYYETRW